MSEKTITRAFGERQPAIPMFRMKAGKLEQATNGDWNLHSAEVLVPLLDHEAALAARDARIAELEREQDRGFSILEMYGVPRQRAKQVSNGIDVLMTRIGRADRSHAMTVQALNALRAAIEAKAAEWEAEWHRSDYHSDENDHGLACFHHAQALRALLEPKP